MALSESAKILVVEDEPSQREMLVYNLEQEGYAVIWAEDGDEAILLAKEEAPDVIVLDWMLPSISGIEVCRQLKASATTSEIAIIMLTARGEEADRVRGLTTGADDYVVKPYSVSELLARIQVRLRHSKPSATGGMLTFSDITLDTAQYRVMRGGKALKLGPTEFKMLTVFMERPKRVWSRDQLLDKVWGHDALVDLRTVDVHVGRLRKALNRDGEDNVIRTVRGAGYSLDNEG
ncbi:phosphate regulon transcriptional regulator PhoB [Pseudahrensia aquimaris]|uniref:Phosphate regulon transcriptional regulatory protein PhoB n=1 Tax=Pseudahrensia aquimaris TaxID=744461 RepID=A0ABW3FF61_9HYPH